MPFIIILILVALASVIAWFGPGLFIGIVVIYVAATGLGAIASVGGRRGGR